MPGGNTTHEMKAGAWNIVHIYDAGSKATCAATPNGIEYWWLKGFVADAGESLIDVGGSELTTPNCSPTLLTFKDPASTNASRTSLRTCQHLCFRSEYYKIPIQRFSSFTPPNRRQS